MVNAVWATAGTAGLLIVVYSRQTSIWAAILVIFLASLPIAMVNTAIEPLLVQVTPRAMLGRVISVITPVMSAVQLSSTILFGWLISTVMLHFHADVGGLHLGPIDTIFTGTGLLFVAGRDRACSRLRTRLRVLCNHLGPSAL